MIIVTGGKKGEQKGAMPGIESFRTSDRAEETTADDREEEQNKYGATGGQEEAGRERQSRGSTPRCEKKINTGVCPRVVLQRQPRTEIRRPSGQ